METRGRERLRSRRLALALLGAWLAACAQAGPVIEPPAPAPPPPPPPPLTPPVAPLRIGAILPATGDSQLRMYGDLIRQGIDMAVSEQDREIELIVLDDAGDDTRSTALIRDLETRGAVGVVGPLLGSAVQRAAAARSDPALAIISPTSTQHPDGSPNVYTLNAGDTRGAEALAQFAAREGLGPIGVLYPRTPEFDADARAFVAALERLGRSAAVVVPFVPGTTTFAEPLQRLRAAGIGAVYVSATMRDVRQLAPQFQFYGLQDVQILGNEAWAETDVLRSVQAERLEGAIVAVPLFRTSPQVAWQEFVDRYESLHRRTLDNPYPALGYDAARLILQAARAERPQRAEVARLLAETEAHRGATGVLSLTEGHVTRRPFLVRILAGEAVLIPITVR